MALSRTLPNSHRLRVPFATLSLKITHFSLTPFTGSGAKFTGLWTSCSRNPIHTQWMQRDPVPCWQLFLDCSFLRHGYNSFYRHLRGCGLFCVCKPPLWKGPPGFDHLLSWRCVKATFIRKWKCEASVTLQVSLGYWTFTWDFSGAEIMLEKKNWIFFSPCYHFKAGKGVKGKYSCLRAVSE